MSFLRRANQRIRRDQLINDIQDVWLPFYPMNHRKRFGRTYLMIMLNSSVGRCFDKGGLYKIWGGGGHVKALATGIEMESSYQYPFCEELIKG